MPSLSTNSLSRLTHFVLWLSLLPLTGCAAMSADKTTSETPAYNKDLSGNWKIALKGSDGSGAGTLSGSLSEEQTNSATHFTTAILNLDSTCTPNDSIIPLDGSTNGSRLQVSALQVNDQQLSLDLMGDSSGTQLTGTFTASGGCLGTQQGSASGTKYPVLSGLYSGAFDSAGDVLSLSLVQDTQAGGSGTFALAGSIAATGTTCSADGVLSTASSFVRGDTFVINITMSNESSTSLHLEGSLNTDGNILTVTSVTAGSTLCGSFYDTFPLQKQ